MKTEKQKQTKYLELRYPFVYPIFVCFRKHQKLDFLHVLKIIFSHKVVLFLVNNSFTVCRSDWIGC